MINSMSDRVGYPDSHEEIYLEIPHNPRSQVSLSQIVYCGWLIQFWLGRRSCRGAIAVLHPTIKIVVLQNGTEAIRSIGRTRVAAKSE